MTTTAMTTTAMTTTDTVIPIRAGEGLPLPLAPVNGSRPATRGPVLVVHGAGVRANLFRPPVKETFVDALLDAGWDVWLLNWRASIDPAPHQREVGQGARHDHPVAVQTGFGLPRNPT